jgi:hypothetical protein
MPDDPKNPPRVTLSPVARKEIEDELDVLVWELKSTPTIGLAHERFVIRRIRELTRLLASVAPAEGGQGELK